MALAVWRLARLSRYLPSNTRAITTAEASKYRCGMRPAAVAHSYRLKPYPALVPRATSKSMLPAPARTAFQAAT
ncbi:hypothetical protein D3C76_985760 [compost metagenome]